MSTHHDDQDAQRREERIAAYVDDQMGPSERRAFEQEMERDPELHREVAASRRAWEAARGWVEAPAPGLEHMTSSPGEELIGGPGRASSTASRLDRCYRNRSKTSQPRDAAFRLIARCSGRSDNFLRRWQWARPQAPRQPWP